MKISQILGMFSGASAVILGAIALSSNPSPERYQLYAGQQIAFYLKDNVCQNPDDSLPVNLGPVGRDALENYCQTIVDASQPQLGELIGEQTTYENYLFFGIYQTEIKLPAPFPHYSFESIGLFNHFLTYRAEKS